MDYIYDVDEVIASPPYWLGMNESLMQCHQFGVPSDRLTLQKLVNRQLNAALGFDPEVHEELNPPYGEVTHKTAENPNGTKRNIRYIVPYDDPFVSLEFCRYWRVDTVYDMVPHDQGWMQYTEFLTRFLVQRQIEGATEAQDALWFLPAIYIDDSTWGMPVTDPESMPIVLGREAYGLPKAPGEIYYCTPDMMVPGYLSLRIWDNPTADRVKLVDAIYSDPAGTGPPAPGYCGGPPVELEAGSGLGEDGRYGQLAGLLGLRDPGELKDRLSSQVPEEVRRRLSPRDARVARILEMSDEPTENLVLLEDLNLFAKLVGLKQFPDPTSSNQAGQKIRACYQAFCESSIEEPSGGLEYGMPNNPQTLHFNPAVHRVKLRTRLGLASDDLTVPASNISWWRGRLVYGEPERTDVFEI